MNFLSIAKNYLVWHYGLAIGDILNIWWNYLWFVNHLFSVPDVLRSLFSPFKRLQEEKVNILMHPEDFFSGLAVNFIMRVVGFLLRSVIVSMAIVGFIVVIIGGLLFLALWILLPVLVANFIFSGIQSLFS